MAKLSWQELYDLAARHGARPGADLCVCAAADAESGRDPMAVGDQGRSFGLWQLFTGGGLGTGHVPADLQDPDYAADIIVPLFNQTYQDGLKAGYTGEELVRYCTVFTERPAGYPDLHSPAADRYAASWYAAVAALSGEEPPVNDLVEQWIAAMEALTGVGYVFGGKDVVRDGGLDCSGLLTSTARTVGLDLGDPDMTSADGLKAYCDPVTESDVQRGDIVLFSQTYGNGDPDYATHCGVHLHDQVMIDEHDSVHETNYGQPYWQQHLMGFWRPRALATPDDGEDMARIAELETTISEMQRVATEEVLPNLDKALSTKLSKVAREALESGAKPAAQTIARAGAPE